MSASIGHLGVSIVFDGPSKLRQQLCLFSCAAPGSTLSRLPGGLIVGLMQQEAYVGSTCWGVTPCVPAALVDPCASVL